MEVTTRQGVFRGAPTGSGWTFKGIPYAEAARFGASGPPRPHRGVADATEYGATVSTPPQRSPVIDALLPDPVRPGANGLNLNIWTPGVEGRVPVLVFVHGGGFATGAGSTTAFDGTSFARDGVVAVTINYRLAAEGFGYFPDAVPNRGLLDMIAALEWIQAEIASFGGDPGRVTISGESAGAMAVCNLLAVPRARGLFRRAISQSGTAHHVHTAERGRLVVAELAAELGCEPKAEAIAAVPEDTLHAASNVVMGRMTSGQDPRFAAFTRLTFQPVIDGEILPKHPFVPAAEVDLLIGANAAEYGLFVAPTGLWDTLTGDALRVATARIRPDPDALIAAYRSRRQGASPAELFVAIQSDWFCVAPTERLAAAYRGAYAYQFAWRPPTYAGRLGACHTLEIPFVFDTLDDPWGIELRGPDAPQAVADEVHGAWVAFVRDGDPGWPVYGASRTVRRFGTRSETVTDPWAEAREAWAGRDF